MAQIALTQQPPKPPDADFAFYIDYKKGEGSASRVFSAMNNFIVACETIDRELVSCVDSHIETVMLLEDIEAASLKVWLRSLLNAADDDALKNLDWRPLVGKYLVDAKYLVLRYIDDPNMPKDIGSLRNEIQRLAAGTDVRHLPSYTPVNPSALIQAIENFQRVKDDLVEGDIASIIADHDHHDMNLSIQWDVESIRQLSVRETTATPSSMILVVKKPDYLSESQWDFRHGRLSLSAKIEDTRWLAAFQTRQVDVRPGDALRCRVRIEVSYGFDNEVVAEKYFIEAVTEVIQNAYFNQGSLDV